MTDPGLLLDLVAAVLVAFAGGALAQRLGLPVVVGYLLAGMAIGPFTPGFHANQHSIDTLAEIGVTFLMFAIGAEFSRAELRRLGRVGLLGGLGQIVATAAIGPALAPALGFTPFQGVFLGALLALSSTVVALKLLGARGELGSLHGHVALGILVAQDLAAIPLVVVLPHAGASGGQLAADLLRAGAEAAALVVGAYLIGVRAVPWLLGHVAIQRTRELFLLGEYIDAQTARGWGLVNRVAPAEELESDALAIAHELAANAPLSQRGNKRVIATLLATQSALPAELERELIELRRASFESHDLREGMSAFAEKRPPRWRGA